MVFLEEMADKDQLEIQGRMVDQDSKDHLDHQDLREELCTQGGEVAHVQIMKKQS